MFDDHFINTDERVVHLDEDHHYFYFGEGDNPRAGIFYIHRDKKGEWCSIPLDIKPEDDEPQYEGSAWHVMGGNYENLSLEPSIVCTICGSHGYIVENKWTDPFSGLPDVSVVDILLKTAPAPFDHPANWLDVFEHISSSISKQEVVMDLVASYNEVGEFWNPVVVKDGHVIEGRVRVYVAYRLKIPTLKVQIVKEEDVSAGQHHTEDTPIGD
jgi:hypothetical protein